LDLINDVLDLSRMDAVEMTLQSEQCDIGIVIQEAIDTMADFITRRGLVVEACLSESLPPLFIDRTRIRQVVLNLLNNAARFTEEGSITVSASTSDSHVLVSVADTGIGISREDLPRIFEEFRQADMSIRRPAGGAGLGLAISKRLIELHGGRIWAESEPGRGSVFTFSLPLAQNVPVGLLSHTKSRVPQQPGPSRELILVETDPALGTLLNRYLDDYTIIQTESLAQGQRWIMQRHPHAVILNVWPGEDIQCILHEVTETIPPHVPVVLCSLPSEGSVGLDSGAQGYLAKPITREALIEHVRRFRARKVLVVDDDRGFVQLVARYLSAIGGIVTQWAYSGEEALVQIEASPPDLILLDLALPGKDGLQIMRIIREDSRLRRIPVVIVTATDYAEHILKRRGCLISVARGQGFSVQEAIGHVRALLDSSPTVYPHDSVSVPQEAGLC
jgi:DNA-binding response OmpR family regulator/anti-sigma regulatory factor (Ser/Thr protein kinase)